MVTRAPTSPTMPKAVKNIPSSQNWTVLKVCNKCAEMKGGWLNCVNFISLYCFDTAMAIRFWAFGDRM